VEGFVVYKFGMWRCVCRKEDVGWGGGGLLKRRCVEGMVVGLESYFSRNEKDRFNTLEFLRVGDLMLAGVLVIGGSQTI